MAKGWDKVQQQAEARAEADARRQDTFLPELRVNQNHQGPFVIRFLEQGGDVNSFTVHEYKVQSQPGQWNTRFATCLSEVGQDCPMCRAGMKAKTRGVYNIIQRQRPIYRKDGDGKVMRDGANQPYIDGYADTVVIANVGSLTADMLRQADGQYQGLMSRDFVVSFSGNKFQSWNLSPALDQQGNAMATPMSEYDFQLAAAKHDIDKYMAPPSAQEAAQIVTRYGNNSGATQPQGQPSQQPHPVLAGVPQQALAAAGMNSFGLATGVQPQPAAAQYAQVPQQAPPQQAPAPQAPNYQPQPVGQHVPQQLPTPQQFQQAGVGVPAQAAPPPQQQPQPAPLQPAQQQFS